jgi:hypothetical protein
MTGLAFGPREPQWVRAARNAYYRPLIRKMYLEGRISETDSGMAWLYRVKAKP